jgi:hypothetical protein
MNFIANQAQQRQWQQKSPTGSDRAFSLGSKASVRDDADRLLVQWTTVAELDATVYLREQGVVTAHADILARMDLRTTLSNDNAAGGYGLPTESLYPKAFRI